jgi:Fe-S cluster biogenesis protein NfuA
MNDPTSRANANTAAKTGGGASAEQIDSVLNELRPAMGVDGGGVDLLAVEGGRIEVRLKGACVTCPSADLTLKRGIEATLKSRFAWVAEVVRVT